MRRAIVLALAIVGGCSRELAGKYSMTFDESTTSDGALSNQNTGAITINVMRGEKGVLVTFADGSILADACALEAQLDEMNSGRAVFDVGRSCLVKIAGSDSVTLRVTGGAIERGVGGKLSGTIVGDLWGMPGFPPNAPSARYSLALHAR